MKTINHCFIIIALLSIIACNKSPDKKFNIKITKTESGYFYDIYKKNKIIIHQPNIPAAIGDQQFKDSILVISYRSDGIPSIEKIKDILILKGKKITVHESNEMKYVLSNKKSSEILIVAE